MVVEVSHCDEEPPSHGGVLSPVQEPPTLPEKGLEEGPVLGGHATEGDEVNMDVENDRKYPDNDSACISLLATVTSYDEYDCTVATPVHRLGTGLDTDVQYVQHSGCTVDLEKDDGGPGSQYLERTPSMVNGVHERFVDVHSLVREWEELENCKEEWEVNEGRRRGGRRVSKRMSELQGLQDMVLLTGLPPDLATLQRKMETALKLMLLQNNYLQGD